MKVLAVCTVRLMKNGISTVISQYYEYLKDRTDFDIVCLNEADPDTVQRIESSGGKVFVLRERRQRPVSYVRALARICRDGGYDIVHIHGNSSSVLLELLAARRAGARIVHAHAATSAHPLLNRLLRPAVSLLADRRLACSDRAGRFLYGGRRFTVLPNAFDTESFEFDAQKRADYRKALSLRDDDFVVGCVAVFSEVKNHTFLIDTFCEYCRYNSSARLLLAGDGRLYQEIRKYALSKPFGDKIIFLGVRNDVSGLLNCFDQVLFPSKSEGLGISLLEAQANGLPVIANKEGISEAVKINPNFLFLPADDPRRWALQLFRHPGKRISGGAENVRRAGYDINCQGEKLYRVYSSLQKRQHSRRRQDR